MNKRLDLTKLGGYPLTQKDLDWMQESYREAFGAMSQLIGTDVIISGMVETAGSITNGWISLAGELLPFVGGAIGTGEFIIDETSVSRVFKDGISKLVRYERVARFSAGGAYQYANLKRPGTIKEAWQRFDVKEIDCDNAYMAANFDVTGLGINERIGWAICNGNNGTKNRSGKVSVAFSDADADFGTLGTAAGAKTHTLITGEIPAHNHLLFANVKTNVTVTSGTQATYGDSGSNYLIAGTATAATLGKSSSEGGGGAHNNMQPYIVSLHIMKL